MGFSLVVAANDTSQEAVGQGLPVFGDLLTCVAFGLLPISGKISLLITCRISGWSSCTNLDSLSVFPALNLNWDVFVDRTCISTCLSPYCSRTGRWSAHHRALTRGQWRWPLGAPPRLLAWDTSVSMLHCILLRMYLYEGRVLEAAVTKRFFRGRVWSRMWRGWCPVISKVEKCVPNRIHIPLVIMVV